MLKKILFQDIVGLWLLLTGCLMGGLVFNEMRTAPLPLVYSTAQSRLDRSVEHLNSTETSAVALDGDVAREEMQKLSANRAAWILDARPEIFFRLGHIPSALSLPRDDFEKQYQALR